MKTRTIPVVCLLAVAIGGLPLSAEPALAQRGRVIVRPPGTVYRPPVYRGPAYRPYYYPAYRYPRYGYGYLPAQPYYAYWNYYYANPSYYYVDPGYYYGVYPTDYSGYSSAYFPGYDNHGSSPYASPRPAPAPAPAPRADQATLNVRLPVPTAVVWIEGVRTTQTGVTRTFYSPSLSPGSDYTYHVRARWVESGRTVEQERTAPVHAGQQSTLDFTTPAPAKLPAGTQSGAQQPAAQAKRHVCLLRRQPAQRPLDVNNPSPPPPSTTPVTPVDTPVGAGDPLPLSSNNASVAPSLRASFPPCSVSASPSQLFACISAAHRASWWNA